MKQGDKLLLQLKTKRSVTNKSRAAGHKKMATQEIKKQIVDVYNAKGLKSVYSFLSKQGIKFQKNVVEFGLNTNSKAGKEKSNWINVSELRFHYYSLGIRARHSGYSYNRIRGIEIVLL